MIKPHGHLPRKLFQVLTRVSRTWAKYILKPLMSYFQFNFSSLGVIFPQTALSKLRPVIVAFLFHIGMLHPVSEIVVVSFNLFS